MRLPLFKLALIGGMWIVTGLGPLGVQAETINEPYDLTTLAGMAGSTGSVDGTGSIARFSSPYGVAVDNAGNLYVSDRGNHTIRKIRPDGAVTTLAGLAGSSGRADGMGSVARFNGPAGVAVDSGGNVYVADYNNHQIRKISPGGVVGTLAGTGSSGAMDGQGSAGSSFSCPTGVAVDRGGNVFVADTYNATVRKITPGGMVSTLAGQAGSTGSADGTGSSARFGIFSLTNVAADNDGNVYVSDSVNNTIRKITPGGVVTTLTGSAGLNGISDGKGSEAGFRSPQGVAVDGAGIVYVTDSYGMRKIRPEGLVTSIAWNLTGVYGTNSEGGLKFPSGLAVDVSGNIYVAETGSFTIRKGSLPFSGTPMIFVAPASQPMIIGASGILKVVAGGVLPLRYQWLRNGVSIAGHTNAILTIDPVQAADAGNYTALVSNAVGSITSPAAVVTVFEALQPGMLKWKFRAKSEMQSCPAIGADGTVYIASGSENKLYALDGVTGQMKWEFLAGGWLPTSPAIGPEGTIFLASLDSRIYALNGSTGQKKWEFLTGSSVWNSPAIGADGTVYVVSDNDKVFALDGATGKKKWEYLPPSQGWSSSPMIGADGTVYLGGSDLSTSFQIYALDNATGKKKWEFPTGSSTLAIGAGGTVYINAPESGNGKICALNGATGQKEWEVPPGYSWLSAPAIGVDGTLYAGSNDKKVYALDGMTGQKKWEFSTGDGVSYAPAIGADNTVYVGSNDKKVYALDGMTGQKKWEFLTGDAVCSSPAIAVDGTVYIGSNDKCVYALVGSSRGGLANSSWPKARCDARNSGRVPEILGVRALASRVAREGSSANLSVQVVGERPLSLQWLFNGQPIVGATNTDYLISSVSTNHAGTYSVIGSNASGSVTNEPAILGVNNVVSSNFLGFLASVPSNSSLKIQSSPSILGPWSTLADATLLSGPYGFIDLSSTNAPRRFYRTQRSGGGAAQDRLELCWFPGWTLNASAGSRYRIEYVNAQTGFDNWQFLTNLSLPNGPYLFIDTAATNQWPRYYRTTPLP